MRQSLTMTTPIDPRQFRKALGNFATGVTVITASTADGRRTGVTANSFNSVSLDPPLVLWSIDKRSGSVGIFEEATHFTVNILAADQMHISNQFARSADDKFAGIPVQPGVGGSFVIEGCAASFQCEKFQTIEGGDHWILLGKVVAFNDAGSVPLLYHQGSYAAPLPHPLVSKKEDRSPTGTIFSERLSDNLYYLMTQAVRSYHDAYHPERIKAGLTVAESRLLMILDSGNAASISDLVLEAGMPQREVEPFVEQLRDKGLIQASGNGYALTEAGKAASTKVWDLAQNQQQKVFSRFTEVELHAFRTILREVINQPVA